MTIFAAYLIFSMLAVIWFDATRYIIPNWLVGSLLLLYPIAVFMSPTPIDWQMALAAMGIMFAIGYIIFALNWMGGGDVKLIIACALWTGFSHLLEFIVLVGMLGGLLSVVVWIARKILPHVPKLGKLPRILREGEPIPYGLAIASGFLILLWQGMIPAAMH